MSNRSRTGVAAGWLCRAALVTGILAGAWAATLTAAAKDRPAAGKPSDEGVFGPGKVWKVHLTLPEKEYGAMQPRGGWGFAPKPQAPATPGEPAREVHRNTFGVNLPWATGSVTLDGEAFQNVGIRYKGNGTIADAARSIKKSFKIDLDRFGGKARFHGAKAINLHCGAADPSKCRETFGYGLYRAAGVPASRTALAEVRLTVPGKYDQELLGVYTMVEDVDKRFLHTHFGNDNGLLMKPEGLREFQHQGDDWEQYKKRYAPKRDATKAEAGRVIAFARLVHKADDAEFRKGIASYLDVDAYLRYLAATSFVANADSFFSLGHNYYLYLHPKTGRFHFFPWDLDRAFANLPFLGSNTQQLDLSITRPYAGTHRLTERVLALPGVSAKYQELFRELAATCFAKERLLKEVEALEAATKDLAARDAKAAAARKESGGSAFGPPGLFGKPAALKTFVVKRTESVAAQLSGKSKGHIPSGLFKIGDMVAGPLLDMLDGDKDERLSKDEWAAATNKVFAACAKDSQEGLTQKNIADGLNGMFPKPAEGMPAPPPGFGPGNFMSGPILKRADADKDGKVTREELVAAAGTLFDQSDRGKAGKLDETAFGELLNALFPMPNFGAPAARPAPAPPKREAKGEKKS